jgi:glycerophosphoryl diester phosphodiesterase
MNKGIKMTLAIIMCILILGFIGYLYLTGAQKSDKDISWLTEHPLAHRGLHNELYIENSMGAFKNAVENGYPIELDVMFTADKQVVVFHDDNLARLTGDTRNVSEVNYEELRTILLKGEGENSFEEAYIPLLTEVLELVNGDVPILIEIKDCKGVTTLCEAVYDILKDYKGEYAIQSFNPFAVEWYANNAQEVTRGQLSGLMSDSLNLKFYEKFALKNMLLNFKSKPHFIAYEAKGLPKFRISMLRKQGIPILGWTIRSIEEAQAASFNCDNIIMENYLVD